MSETKTKTGNDSSTPAGNIKTFTAKCNNCSWIGSKYKLILKPEGDYCPQCESPDVIIYGIKQKPLS